MRVTRWSASASPRWASFLELPANGVRTRFGREAHRFHQEASGALATPFQPLAPREPVVSSVHLDDPETNLERLLTVIDRELRSLSRTLDACAHVLVSVAVQLRFDDGSQTAERLQPASPRWISRRSWSCCDCGWRPCSNARECTRRGRMWQSSVKERRGVIRRRSCSPRARRGMPPACRTGEWLAFRAELGDQSVVRRGTPRRAFYRRHAFAWEPVEAVADARRARSKSPPLVRRIQSRAVPFSPGRHRDAQAELIRHIDEGTVRETVGPFIVSGGWWSREVQREYYFVRTSNHRVLWMYYDRPRMSWFIQVS
jgi:protein ImuB